MRSKNKKRKSAFRRGEKLAVFLKRGTVIMLVIVFAAAAVLGVKLLVRQFSIKEIIVSGNYHLDRDDIIGSINIKNGDQLLNVQFKDVNEKLGKNPWIKDVSLKKQLPGTLLIDIEEAVPKALLRIKRKLYLIDREGRILERIKGDSMLFLPVIKDIRPKNEKGMSEALKLVDVLMKRDIFADRESVEIGLETYGLTMKIDGEFIKVGYGKYSEKYDMWIELEPEIRKKSVPIKYV
ncbi:MAG: FtsQ-type POTRA domain-containing protein, partial [Thermodesulfovibrionia bacterium]|nr:FtsQ-type POTRA domain-containing protein [Thermodesulfovibrionia bacterium]